MTVEVSRRSVLIGGMAVLATALPVPAMALRLHALDSNSDKLNEGRKIHGNNHDQRRNADFLQGLGS